MKLQAALLLVPAVVHGAMFTVTNLSDFNEFADPPVLGSLRQVILAANADPGGVHTIQFDPGLSGELVLVQRLPKIVFSGVIEHPGPAWVSLRAAGVTDWMLSADYDSARRYCNWLHHGAHSGSDTESGACDMAGNVAEMLESPHSGSMPLKGGSFAESDLAVALGSASSTRGKSTPGVSTGFRVATRPPQP